MTDSSQQQDDFEKRDKRHAARNMAASEPAKYCTHDQGCCESKRQLTERCGGRECHSGGLLASHQGRAASIGKSLRLCKPGTQFKCDRIRHGWFQALIENR